MHGGTRGDDLALRLTADVHTVMQPGSRALLRFDMPLAEGETAAGRVRTRASKELSVAVFEQPGGSFHFQAVAYGALHDPTLGPEFVERSRAYVSHFAGSG